MKPRTAQQKGFDFEKTFGEALGIVPTRGSGSQWFAKMDLGDAHMLVSCKHTDHDSFSMKRGLMREVLKECTGDQEPVVAISVNGEVYVVQRAGDWIAGRTADGTGRVLDPTKSEAKRRSAKVPALLRAREGDE